MILALHVIDAFADRPFAGNPAAFLALYALANALRFTERTKLEDADGNHDVVCPDGTVTFWLSRVRS